MFDVTDDGPVRRLVIDNPDRKNAIPRDGWAALAAHLDEFERSDARALIITGRGGDFCSGADLANDFASAPSSVADHQAAMAVVNRAALALHRLSKPVVAAVDGAAVGAGMNLALGCDIVICSDRARFAASFVLRGLAVDFGGTWLLPRIVGLAVARDLALTGRTVDAEEALRIGLVARVVTPDRLDETAAGAAGELAAGAPLAQRFIKHGMDRSIGMSFEQAIAFEAQAQSLCLSSGDAVEGVVAFLEKRIPRFRGG